MKQIFYKYLEFIMEYINISDDKVPPTDLNTLIYCKKYYENNKE